MMKNVQENLICAADAVAEGGKGVRFAVTAGGDDATGFVVRYHAKPYAYLNRCAHVPVELDWQPGRFLDSESELIVCSIHGAAYAPLTGRCVAGPCRRGGLTPLAVEERDGSVFWQPTRDTRAASVVLPTQSAAGKSSGQGDAT